MSSRVTVLTRLDVLPARSAAVSFYASHFTIGGSGSGRSPVVLSYIISGQREMKSILFRSSALYLMRRLHGRFTQCRLPFGRITFEYLE